MWCHPIGSTSNHIPRPRASKAAQFYSHNLGYGMPPLPNSEIAPFHSVSGSTAASTCTSHSETEGSHVVGHGHGGFVGHTSVSKPSSSTRPRVSDCSTTPSVMTTGTMTSNSTFGTGVTDDDARSCVSISTQATSLVSPSGYLMRRTFPPEIPIDPHLPRLYRSFYVSSAFGEREAVRQQAEQHGISIPKEPANCMYNSPAHGHLDLYTPRFVKGVGSEKVGLCCICAEPKERGGEDLPLWLKMKVSSYSYHLGFFHGINNADGLPFSPPVEIRHTKRGQVAANEKSELKEGRCHEVSSFKSLTSLSFRFTALVLFLLTSPRLIYSVTNGSLWRALNFKKSKYRNCFGGNMPKG